MAGPYIFLLGLVLPQFCMALPGENIASIQEILLP